MKNEIYVIKKTDRYSTENGTATVAEMVGYCLGEKKAEKRRKEIEDKAYKYKSNGKNYPIVEILKLESLE
jgi:hypothetical protein